MSETREERPAEQARAEGDDRSAFDLFVQAVHLRVSQPVFFFLCAVVVLGWAVSFPLWSDLKSWETSSTRWPAS